MNSHASAMTLDLHECAAEHDARMVGIKKPPPQGSDPVGGGAPQLAVERGLNWPGPLWYRLIFIRVNEGFLCRPFSHKVQISIALSSAMKRRAGVVYSVSRSGADVCVEVQKITWNEDKMNRTIDVVLGIVMERRGEGGALQIDHELLITQRPDNTVYGGYWELPGGKVEPGETPEAALRRELLEEVGIDVQPTLALTPVIHTYPHAQVRLMPFFCLRKQGQCRNLAVQQHRWIRPEAVCDYQFPEANETILQEMLARWEEAAACSPV